MHARAPQVVLEESDGAPPFFLVKVRVYKIVHPPFFFFVSDRSAEGGLLSCCRSGGSNVLQCGDGIERYDEVGYFR
jgi:hypothetical protein